MCHFCGLVWQMLMQEMMKSATWLQGPLRVQQTQLERKVRLLLLLPR